jgi:hypothetical protein
MEMLLAIALVLYGDSVKDRLPPRVEHVRKVARARLLVCAIKPGATSDELTALIGQPGVIDSGPVGVWRLYYISAGVYVTTGWKAAEKDKPDGIYVEEVQTEPLYVVLARLLK